jgi:transcriptional regulator with XRE-family HTH domain
MRSELRRIRRAQDITQQRLAESSGVSQQTISKIENGDASPTLATASRLAQALGVHIEELFPQPNESGASA